MGTISRRHNICEACLEKHYKLGKNGFIRSRAETGVMDICCCCGGLHDTHIYFNSCVSKSGPCKMEKYWAIKNKGEEEIVAGNSTHGVCLECAQSLFGQGKNRLVLSSNKQGDVICCYCGEAKDPIKKFQVYGAHRDKGFYGKNIEPLCGWKDGG